MTPPLIATYRFQLRDGVGFDDVVSRIPWLQELGISHIYLSPLFAARSGSTHGYDVTDPNTVDPVLGGQEGFERLCVAAHEAGLGIVIDIVPNHMAFSPENPYLADVMRFGRDSEYADVFDIDWDKGPICFPTLGASLPELVADGQIGLAGTTEQPALRVYEHAFPLRPGTALPEGPLDLAAVEALLADQHWSLGHWYNDANRVAHRRFFNITDLIGVRQEDPEVFALTHRWIIAQVAAGRIQGLRVDHIDGLARPGEYLERLEAAVGDTLIWAEKIIKPGEALPDWPIAGLTGYEVIAPLTQVLTDPDGLAAMRTAAEGAGWIDYHAEVRAVRRELLSSVFRPELDRLTGAAVKAGAAGEADDIRAGLATLAEHWPVYRSYSADGLSNAEMLADVLKTARESGAPAAGLAEIEALFDAPDDSAMAFKARFEQLTGALTAKSEEDTVFYRDIAYLPFSEVGLEPELATLDREDFVAAMNARADATPFALSTLSTHDTKRSADARAVIIALSRMPDLAQSLYARARAQAAQRGLPEAWGVYGVQTALMMRFADTAKRRIRTHIAKALREAKTLSTHENPDEAVERDVAELCVHLHREIGDGNALWKKDEAAAFDRHFEDAMLTQTALQLTAPGVPDIYQGTEVLNVMLTDPDNRRPVDWPWVEDMADRPSRRTAGQKLSLTRRLIALRRDDPELFARGSYALEGNADGSWQVVRTLDGREARVNLGESCPGLSAFSANRQGCAATSTVKASAATNHPDSFRAT